MANLAISKSVLNWIERRHPMALAVVLLPLAILSINLLGWAIGRIGPDDQFMPSGYRVLWVKE